MKNIFDTQVTEELINRLNQLTSDVSPKWGKMNASQMLAHCNVAYEMVYMPENFKKPNIISKWFLKTFVKPIVVGPKPFKKNIRTAPDFIIKETKNFDEEKIKIVNHLEKTAKLGASYFEKRKSISLGKLSKNEWNSLFYKHIDHHFTQFGI